MQKTLDEVRKLFKKDRFATESGAVIDEIGERYAKCSLKLSDSHRNALGAVMGGAIFTLADFAFAVAANWQDPGVVSLSSNIAYLGTAKGEKLTARAWKPGSCHDSDRLQETPCGALKSVDKKIIY